jgi:hypothetical protein
MEGAKTPPRWICGLAQGAIDAAHTIEMVTAPKKEAPYFLKNLFAVLLSSWLLTFCVW